MKQWIFTILFFQLVSGSFAQDIHYDIHGRYVHAITKGTLSQARIIGDIIPDYPAKWILRYVFAGISATRDGISREARSTNDTLSTEQINLLNSADLGTDIGIIIRYKSLNAVTNIIEESMMNYTATVVPETQAEYPAGYAQLTQYLKENAIDRISETYSKQLQQAVVQFTINEEGEIANAQLTKTSGNPEIDKLLLDTITKMPKWKPAEDSHGIKVKQEFEFSVGSAGC